MSSSTLRDCIIIVIFSLLLHNLITSHYVDGSWLVRDDTTWYLNRAQLLWRGVFDDAFVYTVTFPALVGAINLFTHDLVTASMIVNAMAFASALAGTYLLGRASHNRPIAWIGVLVLATNWGFSLWEAVQHPFMLFNAAVVWCLLAYYLVVRFPRRRTAALFGLSVAFALYTRLEGGVYFILLVPILWTIYRSRRDWRQVLQVSLISGVIFGLAAAFYVVVILKNSEPGSEGAGGFSIMSILSAVPVPLDVLSRRYTDTLVSGVIDWWPLWVWWLVLAGLIWDKSRHRVINRALASLIVLNLVYAFILSTWPLPRYIRHYVPFFALLVGAIIWRPALVTRWRGRVVMLLLVAAISQPGVGKVIRLLNRPPVNFRESEYARDAAEADSWLVERGWQNTEIFTLCGQLLPFTRSNFHLIYRLGLRDLAGNSEWWDSPDNLLQYIRENNLLFMVCSTDSIYKDWDTFLEDPSNYSERLQEVGRIGDYVFYQVVSAQASH